MGNQSSSPKNPIPISVTVVNPQPQKHPVAGYVQTNEYKLIYTLIKNKNDTVKSLLQLMGQYGPQNGTGVKGVSASEDTTALALHTPLVDGITVYLVFD